jgi:transcriptional regulator with XRE-family HTH domain
MILINFKTIKSGGIMILTISIKKLLYLIFKGYFCVDKYYLTGIMDTIGQRIKELRTKLNMTQSDLAQKVGMTYVQIGRYEKRGAMPSADVLKKLAEALNTTADYLTIGSSDNVAAEQLKDKELLTLFRAVEQMESSDKSMIKTFLDALVTKRKIQNLAL